MQKALRDEMIGLAQPAHPTIEQLARLVAGWNNYFMAMEISADQQSFEFHAIIQARLLSGSISIVAPDLETYV